MNTILITGGAGYLGLNISLSLLEQKQNIVIVDTLENAYEQHINNLLNSFKDNIVFYKGNACDTDFMKTIFETHKPNIVLHLAAHKYVGESIKIPSIYYSNNMKSLETVLALSKEFEVSRFAFASSAVVYGNADCNPIPENTPHSPLSPYAETKSDGEKLIMAWNEESNIPFTIFRFSNPVGANTRFMFGDHSKKQINNLIPYIVESAIEDKEMIFKGNDHDTPDGTPIRDYIHVSDLSRIVSTVLLTSNDPKEIINISRNQGYSLLEIVTTVQTKLSKNLKYSFISKNENEASISVLDSTKLLDTYHIKYLYNLDDIISSQIKFYNHLKTSPEFN